MLPSLTRLPHCAPVSDSLPDGTLQKIRTQTCHLCEEPLGNRTGSGVTWPGTGDAFVFTACNHVFHKPCIQKWLQAGNRTCPDCRADIGYLQPILRNENPPAPAPGGLFGGANRPGSTPFGPRPSPRPNPSNGSGLFDNPNPNMAPLPPPDDPWWEEMRQRRSQHGQPLVRMPDSPPSHRSNNPFAAPSPPSIREERRNERERIRRERRRQRWERRMADSLPARPMNPFAAPSPPPQRAASDDASSSDESL
jgi:hypothetical protein